MIARFYEFVSLVCIAAIASIALLWHAHRPSLDCTDASTDAEIVACVKAGLIACDPTDALELVDCNSLE